MVIILSCQVDRKISDQPTGDDAEITVKEIRCLFDKEEAYVPIRDVLKQILKNFTSRN